MKGRVFGPGATGRGQPFDTVDLLTDAYNTAFQAELQRSKREFSKRGVQISDESAARAVLERIASEGPRVLGETYMRIAERVQSMEQDAGGGLYSTGNNTMSDQLESVAMGEPGESR